MKHLTYITLITLLLAGTLYGEDANDGEVNSLKCEVLLDTHKRIQCTYTTERQAVDRNILFMWHSQDTPHDDRERTIVLQANHGSVYDYRYFYGRAQGIWEVSVKDEDDDLLASTTYIQE